MLYACRNIQFVLKYMNVLLIKYIHYNASNIKHKWKQSDTFDNNSYILKIYNILFNIKLSLSIKCCLTYYWRLSKYKTDNYFLYLTFFIQKLLVKPFIINILILISTTTLKTCSKAFATVSNSVGIDIRIPVLTATCATVATIIATVSATFSAVNATGTAF